MYWATVCPTSVIVVRAGCLLPHAGAIFPGCLAASEDNPGVRAGIPRSLDGDDPVDLLPAVREIDLEAAGGDLETSLLVVRRHVVVGVHLIDLRQEQAVDALDQLPVVGSGLALVVVLARAVRTDPDDRALTGDNF